MKNRESLITGTIASCSSRLVHLLFERDPLLILPMSDYCAKIICEPKREISAGAALRMIQRTGCSFTQRHIFALYGKIACESRLVISEVSFLYKCVMGGVTRYSKIRVRISWRKDGNRWRFTKIRISQLRPECHLVIQNSVPQICIGELALPLSMVMFMRTSDAETRIYLSDKKDPVILDQNAAQLMSNTPGLMMIQSCAVNLTYIDYISANMIRMSNDYHINHLDRHETAVLHDFLKGNE